MGNSIFTIRNLPHLTSQVNQTLKLHQIELRPFNPSHIASFTITQLPNPRTS